MDPGAAARRAKALAAIDEDWNPATLGWRVDWQRHYAYLTQLLDEGARLKAITPGVTRPGEDVGRWLAAQRRDWARLNAEQQARFAALGVTPGTYRAGPPGARKDERGSGSGRGAADFQTGIQARPRARTC
ncbi:helicase associated domain-containing protein [Streptomyces sp. NPDC001594]|uniref:helicase associated domain-containing protein n=1 Tax=Streptomyces sp. NPDC001594 TaxID=3364590 RepID=UPI0036A8C276